MKNIILVTLMLISCSLVHATKRTISNPRFSASSSNNVQITRIDVNDMETVVYLSVNQPEGSDILVSSKTYIQSSDGAEKLYVTRAEGITLNENLPVSELQYVSFILHFPKLADQVNRINYRAGENGNYWHIFEIVVNPNLDLIRNLPASQKGYHEMNGKKWKYIKNPMYAAKSTSGLNIVEIELMDTATVIHFEYHGTPNSWIRIPSQTCIQPADGGELLFVKGAVGIPFDEKIVLGETGDFAYTLYFPKLDKKVKSIHYKEVNPGGSWFIFDIEI